MATRTVVCPECDEPVPYGRLSCPNCGSLLASVAGAPRRVEPRRAMTVDVGTVITADAEARPAARPTTRRAVTTRRPAAPRRATSATGGEEPPPPPSRDPVPSPPVQPPPPPADDVVPASAPGDLDDASEPAPPEVQVPPDATPDAGTPSWPGTNGSAPPGAPSILTDWPPPGTVKVPPVAAPTGLRPATTTSEPWRSSAAPVAVPAMPAGAWLPPTAAFGDAVPNGAVAGDPTQAKPRRRPGTAALFADLPFDAPDDLPGWLVAIGSGIAVAGFLLPWAAVVPFTSGFGYTSQWGLAIPSHLLLFAAVLGLLSLAILPNRLPAWIRNGVVPLGFGGLLVGVVWPYVFGGIGSQIGSMSVALSGLLLLVGGLLEVRPRRHGATRPGV